MESLKTGNESVGAENDSPRASIEPIRIEIPGSAGLSKKEDSEREGPEEDLRLVRKTDSDQKADAEPPVEEEKEPGLERKLTKSQKHNQKSRKKRKAMKATAETTKIDPSAEVETESQPEPRADSLTNSEVKETEDVETAQKKKVPASDQELATPSFSFGKKDHRVVDRDTNVRKMSNLSREEVSKASEDNVKGSDDDAIPGTRSGIYGMIHGDIMQHVHEQREQLEIKSQAEGEGSPGAEEPQPELTQPGPPESQTSLEAPVDPLPQTISSPAEAVQQTGELDKTGPKPDQVFEDSDSQDTPALKEADPLEGAAPDEHDSSDSSEDMAEGALKPGSSPAPETRTPPNVEVRQPLEAGQKQVAGGHFSFQNSPFQDLTGPSFGLEESELENPDARGLSEHDQSRADVTSSNIFRKEIENSASEPPLAPTVQSNKGVTLAALNSNFAKKQDVEQISSADGFLSGRNSRIDHIASNELISNIHEHEFGNDLKTEVPEAPEGQLIFQDSTENMPRSRSDEEVTGGTPLSLRQQAPRDRLSSPETKPRVYDDAQDRLIRDLQCSEEGPKLLNASDNLRRFDRPLVPPSEMSLVTPSPSSYSKGGVRSELVSDVKPNPIESEILHNFHGPSRFDARAVESQDFQGSDRRGMDHSPVTDQRYTHQSELINSDRDDDDPYRHQFEDSDNQMEVQDSQLLEPESDEKRHDGLFSNVNSTEKNVDFNSKRRMKEELEHLLGAFWANKVGVGGLTYGQTRVWKEALEQLFGQKDDSYAKLEAINSKLEGQLTSLRVAQLDSSSLITQLETQLTIARQDNESATSRIQALEKMNRQLQAEVTQLRSALQGQTPEETDPIPGTIRRSDRLGPRIPPTKPGSSGGQDKMSFGLASGPGRSFKNEFDPNAPTENYESEPRPSQWGTKRPTESPFPVQPPTTELDLLTPGIPRHIDAALTRSANQKSPRKSIDLALRLFTEYHKLFWDDIGPKSFFYNRLTDQHEFIRVQIRAFLSTLKGSFIATARSLREEFEGATPEEIADRLPERLLEMVRAYRTQVERFRSKLSEH